MVGQPVIHPTYTCLRPSQGCHHVASPVGLACAWMTRQYANPLRNRVMHATMRMCLLKQVDKPTHQRVRSEPYQSLNTPLALSWHLRKRRRRQRAQPRHVTTLTITPPSMKRASHEYGRNDSKTTQWPVVSAITPCFAPECQNERKMQIRKSTSAKYRGKRFWGILLPNRTLTNPFAVYPPKCRH